MFMVYKLRKELKGRIDDVEIFEGMKPVLDELKENHHIGIITSNDREGIHKFLKNNNLTEFDFVYCKSSLFGKHKILEKIVKKKNLKKENVYYIGDEVRDIEAAKTAGVKIISVSWGYNSKKLLNKYEPDFIIDKPEDITRIIKNEN